MIRMHVFICALSLDLVPQADRRACSSRCQQRASEGSIDCMQDCQWPSIAVLHPSRIWQVFAPHKSKVWRSAPPLHWAVIAEVWQRAIAAHGLMRPSDIGKILVLRRPCLAHHISPT